MGSIVGEFEEIATAAAGRAGAQRIEQPVEEGDRTEEVDGRR